MLLFREIPFARGDLDLHLEIALAVDGGDMELGVQDLDVGRDLEISRLEFGLPLRAEESAPGAIAKVLESNLLQVQDDVGDVLEHARDRREFMPDLLVHDPQRGDRDALKRRQQDPTECIAESEAEAPLERLDDETAIPIRRNRLIGGDPLRHLKGLPLHPTDTSCLRVSYP